MTKRQPNVTLLRSSMQSDKVSGSLQTPSFEQKLSFSELSIQPFFKQVCKVRSSRLWYFIQIQQVRIYRERRRPFIEDLLIEDFLIEGLSREDFSLVKDQFERVLFMREETSKKYHFYDCEEKLPLFIERSSFSRGHYEIRTQATYFDLNRQYF